VPLLLLVLLILAAPDRARGQADALPRCEPAAHGTIACVAGKLCQCVFDPGGALAGLPPGHRWDCGALRPECGPFEPAESGGWDGRLPDSVGIDTTIIDIDQRQRAIQRVEPGRPRPPVPRPKPPRPLPLPQ
jgi:hypothetical protein